MGATMQQEPQWTNIHQDLALTAELLQTDPSPRQLSMVLAQRAEQFAAEVQATTPLNQHHFLSFTIGDEHYGIDVQTVQTIVPLQRFTAVPDALPCYVGVANIKGQMISLLYLPRLFGLANTDTTNARFIIVTSASGLVLGVLADIVHDVISMQDDYLMQHVTDDPSLVAVLPTGVALLDVNRIFEDPRVRPERGRT